MRSSPAITRAAVVQAASVAFDRERTLEKVADLTADAAGRGAKLVVFPEAFVSAYPKGLTFGAVVGSRTPEGRDEYRRYWDSAMTVPGPAVDTLAAIATQNAVYLVIGVIERDGGTLYCTVPFFAPEGRYLGKHRKLMPTGAERLVWGFGDGSTLPIFDTPLGRLGAVICWENYMPLMRMAMYAKGIQIDPLGQILAGPDFERECILTADLDMGDIVRGKYDFDVVGHYARPDVFRLHVNGQPQPVIE